jgi:hypothetical protein
VNFAAATCYHFAVDNAQAGYSHIEPHRHLLSLMTDRISTTALTTRCCLHRLLLDFTRKASLFLPGTPTHLQLLHISTTLKLISHAAALTIQHPSLLSQQ